MHLTTYEYTIYSLGGVIAPNSEKKSNKIDITDTVEWGVLIEIGWGGDISPEPPTVNTYVDSTYDVGGGHGQKTIAANVQSSTLTIPSECNGNAAIAYIPQGVCAPSEVAIGVANTDETVDIEIFHCKAVCLKLKGFRPSCKSVPM